MSRGSAAAGSGVRAAGINAGAVVVAAGASSKLGSETASLTMRSPEGTNGWATGSPELSRSR
jgi:hypothetical protein